MHKWLSLVGFDFFHTCAGGPSSVGSLKRVRSYTWEKLWIVSFLSSFHHIRQNLCMCVDIGDQCFKLLFLTRRGSCPSYWKSEWQIKLSAWNVWTVNLWLTLEFWTWGFVTGHLAPDICHPGYRYLHYFRRTEMSGLFWSCLRWSFGFLANRTHVLAKQLTEHPRQPVQPRNHHIRVLLVILPLIILQLLFFSKLSLSRWKNSYCCCPNGRWWQYIH